MPNVYARPFRDGTVNAWIPNTAPAWHCVDDTIDAPDDATRFISVPFAPPSIQDFLVRALPIHPQAANVQVRLVARLQSTSFPAVLSVMINGVPHNLGTVFTTGPGYETLVTPWTVNNPAALLPWDPSDFNGLGTDSRQVQEIRVQPFTNVTPPDFINCTQFYLEVQFDEPRDESTLPGQFREEHYKCDRCGFNYPRARILAQNGLVVCRGPETNNCFDLPGAAAERIHKFPVIEAHPDPLPSWDGDL